MLVRLARQAEIGLGQKLQKESHGRSLLLVRHPISGTVSVMDAYCFHMGAPLIDGDIEDIDGHSCVICPAHRRRIDMHTGHQVDTDLCGKSCTSEEQMQRLYKVHSDDEFIWVDLPTEPPAPLPSDGYNQVDYAKLYAAVPPAQKSPSAGQNYGLFGASSAAPPAPPLQPYAGLSGWPVVPPSAANTTTTDMMDAVDDPQLVFSQPSAPSPPRQPAAAPPASLMTFYQAQRRPDPPSVARRKAATAAIMKNSYRPPTVDNTPMQSPQKVVAPAAPVQVNAVSASSGSTGSGARQATLFESWARRPVSAGVESMDMN